MGPFPGGNCHHSSSRAGPCWSKGLDLYNDAANQLLQQFRFVPDARLDDLMASYATDGGGVGPHVDSYDVFLLQAHGRRRWRIGRQRDLRLVRGVPLKILSAFEPEQEFVLEPGDMLYLPPRYAHEGVALGECMTYSIGFRAPTQHELARELLQRIAEQVTDPVRAKLYHDAGQPAAAVSSAQVPAGVDSVCAGRVAGCAGRSGGGAARAGRVPYRTQSACLV